MRATVKELGMTWPIAQDGDAKLLSSLNGTGFPTYCLIDRKGKLRMNDLDDSAVESAIKKLLKERP